MASAEGICIFEVNEDILCSTLVAEMLQSCTYEVLMNGGRPLEALSIICANRDSIKVVITNAQRVEGIWASDVLHYVKNSLNLPISFMSPDNNNLNLEEYTFGVYLLKSFNNVDIDDLLRSASLKDEVSLFPQLPSSSQQVVSSTERIAAPSDGSKQIMNGTHIALPLAIDDRINNTNTKITVPVPVNQNSTREIITAPSPITKTLNDGGQPKTATNR
ncbi:OLC1v1001797C1 [Oldenlandia corymbosa var. corymbosa]|uniref:OLC1v1001797C1 n=1 Tax=Oldenlandia corymbosa var. corymbosa TaxID=529605 RepID=A0AAV1D652_OLDCO|nr:OLC1v1001797C1 [Oldenlandia corymbosa var. corymbosa]